MRIPDSWLRVASLAALALLWQLGSMAADDPVFPTPVAVFARLMHEIVDGELLGHLGITLARVAASFVLAMSIGSVIGIWMGSSRTANLLLDGPLVLGLNIPALVVIIVFFIWLGLTEVAAIAAVAVNKIPTVVVMVREGARAVDRDLLQVARAFHLERMTTLHKVYLPQLYPYFMASARNGLALIWKIVLVVELLGRSDGVGFQLGTFFQYFDMSGILAYAFAFAGIIYVLEAAILRPLDNRLARWK